MLKLVYTLDLPAIYDHGQWGMMMNQWILDDEPVDLQSEKGVLAFNEWIPYWDAVFWKQVSLFVEVGHMGPSGQLGGYVLTIRPGDFAITGAHMTTGHDIYQLPSGSLT